jgi:hypothetical protein
MYHDHSRLLKFEAVCRRYNGPIPKRELEKIETYPSDDPSHARKSADVRFWKNYIRAGIKAYRSAKTPRRRELICADIASAWPKYRMAIKALHTTPG